MAADHPKCCCIPDHSKQMWWALRAGDRYKDARCTSKEVVGPKKRFFASIREYEVYGEAGPNPDSDAEDYHCCHVPDLHLVRCVVVVGGLIKWPLRGFGFQDLARGPRLQRVKVDGEAHECMRKCT